MSRFRRNFVEEYSDGEIVTCLDNSKQSNDRQFATIMFDIDFFKQVNDNYGHAGGDAAVLQLHERGVKKDSASAKRGGAVAEMENGELRCAPITHIIMSSPSK